MHITIKYYGQIAEITKLDEESFEFSGKLVSELLDALHLKYENLKSKDFKVAQNQELVLDDTELTGDDVALLPPFAGG